WQRWCDGLAPEHFEVEAQVDRTSAAMVVEAVPAELAPAPRAVPAPAREARPTSTEGVQAAAVAEAIAATSAIAQAGAVPASQPAALRPCYE
ncbi:hypothetical protein SB816_31305, partial [Achromobacter sp. SIMBA_011]